MTKDVEQLVRDTFADQWWYSAQMPVDEVLLRARTRLRHDHDEKCRIVVENLRRACSEREQLRAAHRPLTLAEARVILIADEALCASYEARLASGSTFGIEEREAWGKLVEAAEKFVDVYVRTVLYDGWTACPTCQRDPDPRGPSACFDCRELNRKEIPHG